MVDIPKIMKQNVEVTSASLTAKILQTDNIINTNEKARSVWESYNSDTSYVIGNKVFYNGSSFICKQNCSNILPTNSACWQVIASAGGTVTDATQLLITDTGNYYTNNDTNSALQEVGQRIGDLSQLQTTSNTDLVSAINENTLHLAERVSATMPPYSLVGAKGDGTTDDTSALTTIFNDTRFSEVYIVNKGQPYIISAPIVITRSNIKIIGVGNPTIKLKDNCTPKPFAIFVAESTAKTDIHFEGFTIDCNRQNNIDHGTPDSNGNQLSTWNGTLTCAISLHNVTSFSIHDMTIKESWGGGMWIADCYDGDICNNFIYNYRMSGIAIKNATALTGEPNYITIENNKCYGGVVGIHILFGGKFISVNNNVCYNNKDSNRFPAYAYSGTYPNVYPKTGGFVAYGIGGYISPALQGDGAGIELTGLYTDGSATNNERSTITGNICYNNMVGVRLEEESRYITINGNNCSNNDAYGILLYSVSFNDIVGNTCFGNALHGIKIEKIATKPIPGYNVISGNVCNKNTTFGICLVGAQSNIITNNNLSDNNTVFGNTGGGIGMFYTDSTACTYNIITANMMIAYNSLDKYGIYTDNIGVTVNNSIHGNTFLSQMTSALNLDKTVNIINGNSGYKTTNYGTTKIDAGQTFKSVAHGMPFTPGNGELLITPVTSVLGKFWYVGSVDATNFTVIIDSAAGSDIYFNWCIVEDK